MAKKSNAKMGRPLKYKSVEDLDDAIKEYFDKNPAKPTICGLALDLGFMDRQSLRDYSEREDFSCSIKRAISRIESMHEENLYSNGAAGSIFWLKNRDWKDKQEHEGNMSIHVVNNIPRPKK